MKQTAVEQLGIAFREWQREWDNYDGKKESKPKSFDEFINHFLEMEKQQIIDAYNNGQQKEAKQEFWTKGEQYYNETFKNK
jgi:hypothetical protein